MAPSAWRRAEMGEGLLFERDGATARITLSRPSFGNALTVPMAQALCDAAIVCDEEDSIRCVVVTGAGRFYCAGGDVTGFAEAGEKAPVLIKSVTAPLHSAIARLLRMNKPLITAINGPAAGAGIGLAVMGDIVLVDPAAHFTPAYPAVGLSPDGGASWFLPRLIGMRRTQEFLLTNRRVKAEEAVAMGLATRVCDEGRLMDEASALAATLGASATSALGATRRLLLDSSHNSLETQMELESRSIAAQSRTPEGREGVAAFMDKRPPRFAPPD